MTRYAPLWEAAASYAASVDRRLISTVWPGAGYVTGCAVTVAAGTMNMNIAPGSVVVPTPNNTGSVLCASDAIEVVSSPTAPASGLNRIDLVVCQARGNDLDGGANNDFLFQVVAGTAVTAGTEAAPAVPAGAVAIAQVRVIGGAASLVAANLVDMRLVIGRSVLFYQETASGMGVSGTPADVPGVQLPAPLWIPAGRRIRVAGSTTWQGGGGATTGQLTLLAATTLAGSGILATGSGYSAAASYQTTVVERIFSTVTAGLYSWRLQASCTVGSLNTIASANVPTFLVVEDRGAV